MRRALELETTTQGAEDAASPRPDALALALERCHSALCQDLRSVGDGRSDALRGAIPGLMQLAQTQGVPPERVLSTFKEMMNGVLRATTLSAFERGEVMRNATQVAIESYFGTA